MTGHMEERAGNPQNFWFAADLEFQREHNQGTDGAALTDALLRLVAQGLQVGASPMCMHNSSYVKPALGRRLEPSFGCTETEQSLTALLMNGLATSAPSMTVQLL